MPVVPFDSLPDASRVWVFGSDRKISEEGATHLLKAVDEYLAGWKAHGQPLTVASQMRDDRFLAIAVDQSTAGATGCSIDGLFRLLQTLEPKVGVSLVGGGRVYFRDSHGEAMAARRDEVGALAESGAITKDTVVFDTSLSDLGAFRSGFEKRAKESWIAPLLPASAL